MKFNIKGLAFCTALAVALVACGCKKKNNSHTNETKDFSYEEIDGGYRLTGVEMEDCETINIPSEYKSKPVLEISENAFSKLSLVKNLNLPNTLTSISSSSFKSLDLNYNEYNGGKYLGNNENKYLYLMSFDSRDEVVLNDKTRIIADKVFSQKDIKKINLGSELYKISYRAFYDNDAMYSINLPASLKYIDEEAFYSCDNLYEVFNFTSLNLIPGSLDNGYVSYYAKRVSTDSTDSKVLVKSGFVFIKNDSDEYEMLKYIGSDLNVTLPNDFSYKIADNAFKNSNVESVTIPSSAMSLGDNVFEGCKSLKSVVINDGVTEIGEASFKGDDALMEIVLPKTLKRIGVDAFDGCKILQDVYYSSNTTDWSQITFEAQSMEIKSNPMYFAKRILMLDGTEYKPVTKIVVGDVKSINNAAFLNFKDAESLELADDIEYIGIYAFEGCTKISEATIPANVKTLEHGAFKGCTELKDLYIGKNIELISNIFASSEIRLDAIHYDGDESAYMKIEFRDQYSSIGSLASNIYFKNDGVEYIPVNINITGTSVGNYAFAGFTSLKSVIIDRTVTSFESLCFYGCDSIEEVYYMGSIDDWCKIRFSDYSSNPIHSGASLYVYNAEKAYYEVVNPEISVSTLAAYAFYNSHIKSVVFKSSVRSIGYMAFSGCTELSYVYYEGTEDDYGQVSRYSDASELDKLYVYYYSETSPETPGRYWHYDSSNKPERW